MKLSEEMLENLKEPYLREMRLFHWRAFKSAQESIAALEQEKLYQEKLWDKVSLDSFNYAIETNRKIAAKHLSFVQALNDFFPIGDSAELDAAKQET